MLTLRRTVLPVVVAACAATVAVAVRPTEDSNKDLPTQEALVAYENEFVSVAQALGGVIEIGPAHGHSLKSAIGAIERSELGGRALEDEARLWIDALDDVRARIAALEPPHRLERTQRLFAASAESYRALARTLGVLAEVDDAGEIDAGLDRAVALGERGDDLFDRAAEEIQTMRSELGLDPTTRLPGVDSEPVPGVRIIDD